MAADAEVIASAPSCARIHEDLLADGIAFHTLAPRPGGATVYVADLDGSAAERWRRQQNAMAQTSTTNSAGQNSSAPKSKTERTASNATTRERVYEKNIAESSVEGSAEIWDRIRDRWGKGLALAIAAQREFDPNVANGPPQGGAKPERPARLPPRGRSAEAGEGRSRSVVQADGARDRAPRWLASQAQLKLAAGDKPARDSTG
jgi:hypothetical protein